MTRAPFRGVYAEIGRELGMTSNGVRLACKRKSNTAIITMVADRIRSRKRAYDTAQRRMEDATRA